MKRKETTPSGTIFIVETEAEMQQLDLQKHMFDTIPFGRLREIFNEETGEHEHWEIRPETQEELSLLERLAGVNLLHKLSALI